MKSQTTFKSEVLVIGGTGFIGQAISSRLLQEDYCVASISRGGTQQKTESTTHIQPGQTHRNLLCDVTKESEVESCFSRNFAGQKQLAGLVYSVGRCPPSGFDDEVGTPLSELVGSFFTDQLDMHVAGLFNTIARFHDHIKPGGHIVIIGSAITRLGDENCPPWLNAGHYATAKAAQHEQARWWRRDQKLTERKILVHMISPGAVDTPFHQGCSHQPPALLPVSDVVNRVLDAFDSRVAIDEMLVANAHR